MTTIELIAAIGGGPTITAAGVGVWKLADRWLKDRRENAERDDKREERTETRLWDRVDRLDQRLDDCEEKHRRAEAAAADCERRSKQLEEHVSALQDVVLRNDDTGRYLLETRSTPPKAINLPPPKR